MRAIYPKVSFYLEKIIWTRFYNDQRANTIVLKLKINNLQDILQ